VATWSTDFRHLPPAGHDYRTEQFREIIEAATSRPLTTPWRSAVCCRSGCSTLVMVARSAPDTIEWSCTGCGDAGTITGFQGSEVDYERFVPRGKTLTWGFADEERDPLLNHACDSPRLRAIIARARPHAEVDALLIVNASRDELHALYDFAESLIGVDEFLDAEAICASLATAIDGF
jgi:hypothetical protein